MSSQPKKAKKRKEVKKEVVKETAPQVVTVPLADNTYSGVIREGSLGMQFLECPDGKYEWGSGIKYEGPFVQSRIEGKGKFVWPDGSSFEGELLAGKRHGHGIYFSSDGGSRYEGQWVQGRREGNGKLLYNTDESSYYDGGWLDGKKHGFGKQVWPSGNIYEGEWTFGKMAGEGTMTWRTNAGSERYSGRWVDNNPDGEGTHTWHTLDLTRETLAGASVTDGLGTAEMPTRRAMPLNMQQQMNNSYKGQWSKAKRHGRGTFFYANGARYCGDWASHLKHGHGRHTFEDGTVYEGPFEEDRLVNYRKPHPAEGAELMARCTDLHDLVGLALPTDRAGVMATGGAGYTDTAKIFREVYNILLRHLGELRELYGRYRSLIPRAGSDPFTLQSYQFWLFARDAGLITPSCSLARFNRCVFAGPRHHRDTAPHDMVHWLPLQREETYQARVMSAEGDSKKGHVSITEPSGEDEARDGDLGASASGSEEDSDPPSPTNGGELQRSGDSPGTSAMASPPATPQTGDDKGNFGDPPGSSQGKRGRPVSQDSKGRRMSRRVSSLILGEAFVRAAGGPGIVDTNHDSRPLLFRQFLEGIVRCAPMRFPSDRGLEAQIHRLFKTCILPVAMEPPASEPLFAFLAQRDLQAVLREFHHELFELFKRPQTNAAHREVAPFRAQRRLTVNARHETTIRIKDVLRLLDSCGWLKPLTPTTFPQGDLRGVEVFPVPPEEPAVDDGAASADELGSGGSQSAEKDLTAGFLKGASKSLGGIGGGIGLGAAAFSGFGLGNHDGEESKEESTKGSKKKAKNSKEVPRSQDEIDRDEVQACDFSTTIADALRQLAEAVSPSLLQYVLWELRPPLPSDFAPPGDDGGSSAAGESSSSAGGDDSPQLLWPPEDEQVSVFDYLENSVTFPEFIRLLVHLVEDGVKGNTALSDRLPSSRRLEVFLRHVFLPTLRERYSPPREEEEDAAGGERRDSRESGSNDGEDRAHTPEDASAAAATTAPVVDGAAAPEHAGEEAQFATELAPSEPEVEPPQLWPGFEGACHPPRAAAVTQEVAAFAGGRRGFSRHWLSGYGDEAASW